MRYVDLAEMAADETGNKPVDFVALDRDYASTQLGSTMRQRLDTFLEETSLGAAQLLVDDAMLDQFSRVQFWGERLIEANPVTTAHGLGRFAINH